MRLQIFCVTKVLTEISKHEDNGNHISHKRQTLVYVFNDRYEPIVLDRNYPYLISLHEAILVSLL